MEVALPLFCPLPAAVGVLEPLRRVALTVLQCQGLRCARGGRWICPDLWKRGSKGLSPLFTERKFLSSVWLLSREILGVAVSHHMLLHPSLHGICGVTAGLAFLELLMQLFSNWTRHCHKHHWLLQRFQGPGCAGTPVPLWGMCGPLTALGTC